MAQLVDRRRRKARKPKSLFRRFVRGVEAADAFTSFGAFLLSLYVASHVALTRRKQYAKVQDASAGAFAGFR